MMDFFKRNNALATNGDFVNGADADIHITTHGSDWYFAVCAVMTLATFIFAGLAFRKPASDRVFNYITASITMVAAIAYFTMGANLGFTPIGVEFHRSNHRVAGQNREIFYVRYIDWVITTPLLLLDLLLTAGMPWPSILAVILVDEVMIITGLIGALVQSRYKWAYFVFGCAALLYVVYKLAISGRRRAYALGSDVHQVYLSCGILTLFLWFLYPIAWGVSEGGNVIAPDSEAVFYGILDILAKPVFGALLLFGHRGIEPSRLGLRIRDYDHVPTASTHGEKAPVTGTGARNGVHEPVAANP